MKKLFAIIMTICLLSSAFSMIAFAAEAPSADVALRVSAQLMDGTTVVIEDYNTHVDGWNAAMQLATDSKALSKNGYACVVVDLYTDWTALNGGYFVYGTSKPGFLESTICVPEDVTVILNMNGHTINRNLDESAFNGEVIYVDENATIEINDGTITGGFSENGAGGIHIKEGAHVTLNNVNVDGNRILMDDGGGIAVYDATLIMNGGSVSDNICGSSFLVVCYGGAVYAEDSTVILNDVTIRNNQSSTIFEAMGVAIYADNSDVTLNNCDISDNGHYNEDKNAGAYSVVYVNKKSTFTANGTNFSNNGAHLYISTIKSPGQRFPDALFDIRSGACYLTDCTFSNNNSVELFQINGGELKVVDSTFTDNNSAVFYGYCTDGKASAFVHCTFKNNETENETFNFTSTSNDLTFTGCELNQSTFKNKNYADFVDHAMAPIGSIFAEGSLNMIISLIALVVSISALWVNISANKKKNSDNSSESQGE